MEKTMITKAIAFLLIKGIKFLAKRTDNPVDDNAVEGLEILLGFKSPK